jgi:hypothetical protein
MGRIQNEDIVAYEIGSEVICAECVGAENLENLTEDQVITENEIDESSEIIFCDRCKKQVA